MILLPAFAYSKGKKPSKEIEEKPPVTESTASEKFSTETFNTSDIPTPQTEKVQTEPEISKTELAPSTLQTEVSPVVPMGSKMVSVWIWQESKDCLWRLAKEYYGDPWQWKKIYLANQNLILDPNIIFPKQKIVIPPAEK